MIRLYHARLEELVQYSQNTIAENKANYEQERNELEAKQKKELEAQPQRVHDQLLVLKNMATKFRDANVVLTQKVEDVEEKLNKSETENSSLKKAVAHLREELNKLQSPQSPVSPQTTEPQDSPLQSPSDTEITEKAEKTEQNRKIKKHGTVPRGDDESTKLAFQKESGGGKTSENEKKSPTEQVKKRTIKTARTVSAVEDKPRSKPRPKSQTYEAPPSILDDANHLSTKKKKKINIG